MDEFVQNHMLNPEFFYEGGKIIIQTSSCARMSEMPLGVFHAVT